MGDSLRSVGAWICVISFCAAVIAVANKQIQSSIVWLGLDWWIGAVLFYCLVKLIKAIVRMRSAGRYRTWKELFRRKQPHFKRNIASSDNVLRQISKSKSVSFKLPSLAGFTPEHFQRPVSRSAFQKSSPSKVFASWRRQKAKGEESDFELPSLAGFAPHDLQKPTNKNARQ
jgi:hypothetical protein